MSFNKTIYYELSFEAESKRTKNVKSLAISSDIEGGSYINKVIKTHGLCRID